jgi:hypothetical protein
LATNSPPPGEITHQRPPHGFGGLAPAWRRQRKGGAAGLATGAGKPAGRPPLPGRSGHLAGGGRLGNARGRVLYLEPVRGAPGAVGRVPVLRHNAFILQTCRNTTSAGVAEVLVQALASVALRISSGLRRRSAPSSSRRSKANMKRMRALRLRRSRSQLSSPSHGENRGSSPLGSANHFNNIVALEACRLATSPTFLQWTVLHTVPIERNLRRDI